MTSIDLSSKTISVHTSQWMWAGVCPVWAPPVWWAPWAGPPASLPCWCTRPARHLQHGQYRPYKTSSLWEMSSTLEPADPRLFFTKIPCFFSYFKEQEGVHIHPRLECPTVHVKGDASPLALVELWQWAPGLLEVEPRPPRTVGRYTLHWCSATLCKQIIDDKA